MLYDILQRKIKSLIVKAEHQVQLIGRAPNCILTWNNFKFTEGRRGKRTGNQAAFKLIITALIFKKRGFNAGPLRQHI